MISYNRNEVLSGAFILAFLVILAALTFSSSGLPFLSSRLECEARFENVGGLKTGAKVKVAGCEVGVVKSIALERLEGEPTHVLVRFSLKSSADLLLDIGDDAQSHAEITTDGFLGDPYLSVVTPPGTPTDRLRSVKQWIDGQEGRVVRFRGTSPQDLMALLRAEVLDPVKRDLLPALRNVRSLTEKLNAGMDQDGALGRLIQGLEAIVVDSQVLVKDVRVLLNERIAKDLVGTANQLLQHLDGELTALSPRLRKLLGTLETLLESADHDMAALHTLIEHSDALVTGTRPELSSLLQELSLTTRALRHDMGELQGQVSGLLGETRGVLMEGRPELQETLRRLRRSSWELEMALRKVRADPSVLIWGSDEKAVHPVEADQGRLREAGEAKPLGARDER